MMLTLMMLTTLMLTLMMLTDDADDADADDEADASDDADARVNVLMMQTPRPDLCSRHALLPGLPLTVAAPLPQIRATAGRTLSG